MGYVLFYKVIKDIRPYKYSRVVLLHKGKIDLWNGIRLAIPYIDSKMLKKVSKEMDGKIEMHNGLPVSAFEKSTRLCVIEYNDSRIQIEQIHSPITQQDVANVFNVDVKDIPERIYYDEGIGV